MLAIAMFAIVWAVRFNRLETALPAPKKQTLGNVYDLGS